MSTPHRSEQFFEPLPLAEHAGKWFIATAVAFIVLGTLAVMAPLVAGLAVTTLVGTLLIVGGVTHGIGAFRGGGVGHTFWQIIVTVFYVGAGVYFLTHPLMALGTLTRRNWSPGRLSARSSFSRTSNFTVTCEMPRKACCLPTPWRNPMSARRH